MVSSSAVKPDGRLVLNRHGEDGVADSARHCNGTAEEACGVERFARLGEAALGDGVRHGVEMELDGVANSSSRRFGREFEAAIADLDDVVSSRGG